MHFKVPVFNVVNFAAIFLILYFLDIITSLITVLVATVIGALLGFMVEAIFAKHATDKKGPKPITIGLIAIILILVVSLLITTNIIPVNLSGHSTIEEPEEIVEEVVEEVVEEEPEYAGHCEEKELKKEYNSDAEAYVHVEDWDRLKYDCNTVDDCIEQMLDDDWDNDDFDEENIRCSTEA